MVAYAVFVRERITDPEEMAAYKQKVPASMGDRPITPRAAYGDFKLLEGPEATGAVILEFPTMADAEAWYHSPEYQDAARHRHAGAEYRAFLVEGLARP